MSIFTRLFCSHKWDKVSELMSKSPLEELRKHPGELQCHPLLLRSLTTKKHVIILKCDHCGATKKIVTEIPA